jgi:formate hydrogenlyase subunit 4
MKGVKSSQEVDEKGMHWQFKMCHLPQLIALAAIAEHMFHIAGRRVWTNHVRMGCERMFCFLVVVETVTFATLAHIFN